MEDDVTMMKRVLLRIPRILKCDNCGEMLTIENFVFSHGMWICPFCEKEIHYTIEMEKEMVNYE